MVCNYYNFNIVWCIIRLDMHTSTNIMTMVYHQNYYYANHNVITFYIIIIIIFILEIRCI